MPQYTYDFSQKKTVGRIFFFCGSKFLKKLLRFWRFFKNTSLCNFIFIVYKKSLQILSSFWEKNFVSSILFFRKLQCRKVKRQTRKKQRKYKRKIGMATDVRKGRQFGESFKMYQDTTCRTVKSRPQK